MGNFLYEIIDTAISGSENKGMWPIISWTMSGSGV